MLVVGAEEDCDLIKIMLVKCKSFARNLYFSNHSRAFRKCFVIRSIFYLLGLSSFNFLSSCTWECFMKEGENAKTNSRSFLECFEKN